ncbi:hypothetical protein CEXT_804821 [Caerostris extrusa]|uniref:Uncharacterized protein n=1 Tax=Caerostris extrusa TaxID=172846 RepID=A0AAV4M8H3_CAEEX|nr:hypothetical protein CEXT_804821 [Caerostris extrusa]
MQKDSRRFPKVLCRARGRMVTQRPTTLGNTIIEYSFARNISDLLFYAAYFSYHLAYICHHPVPIILHSMLCIIPSNVPLRINSQRGFFTPRDN